jgi:hypothetical protein
VTERTHRVADLRPGVIDVGPDFVGRPSVAQLGSRLV